ncbi:MAG TPA: NDP-sugar synthase [Candidatus Udaeobacter sp.]|jgi:NDP-sugar pyrophosphorylase family protein
MAAVTQAFVLAAGVGKRLRPLTDDLPKPLIPIFQKPLITFALDHLINAGVNRFVINTHRRPELFRSFFNRGDYAGAPVTLVHEPELLETGGGIKNAERCLGGDPFITYSGDILTDVNLRPLIDEHFRRGNDVTLALRETGLASDIALRDRRVVDVAKRYGIAGNLDFANIAVWNSAIFERIQSQKKISFIPILSNWIGQGGKIGGLVMNDGNWFNIGSRAEYLEVHREILRGNWKPRYIEVSDWPERIAKSAIVDSRAELRGCTVVGEHCRVGAEAVLEDTILWPDAEIASKSQLHDCIVRSKKKVSGIHRNIDI